MKQVFYGNSPVQQSVGGGLGEFVQREGERFYRISNYDRMQPFLMSLVSGFDHWLFVSSNGGLTCGRGNPENALFPYYTDDKIHDASSTTGPEANLLVEKGDRTILWKPFARDVAVYDIERNLYKNPVGNKLVFEEINRDLELIFTYGWSSSERYGFVKKTKIENLGEEEVHVEVLDGLRNVLPYGVTENLQVTMSTLLDAYKQAERIPGFDVAVYTLSSILTDRAEPSEALKATVAWCLGLDQPRVLLSEDQVTAFCGGTGVAAESFKMGKRGAFFVQSSLLLPPGAEESWMILADINKGPSYLPALLDTIKQGVSLETIDRDIDEGSRRLLQLAGRSDGCQLSSDALVSERHFSNTLYNIMRGGTFYDEYRVPAADFLQFVGSWNRPLQAQSQALFDSQSDSRNLAGLVEAAQGSGDADLERLALEYLPLTFSRRHGDPSRPWNKFSIDIRNADGSERLGYQGNWRDIFQNWEALAVSYPEYIESFIAKFVNATTPDGYNPYRISQEGFDWEVEDPAHPWSNIGYWGDHQVNYLLSFLEQSNRYHPGKLNSMLAREIFVYANIPYRLKGYQELLADPRDSVVYDDELAAAIDDRVAQIGFDGKLAVQADGSIYRVNLLEKLLVTLLVKTGNFVPGGGIWMNTQRPEWNDANNALVGYGLSMVTLCYLRRCLVFLAGLLSGETSHTYRISEEVAQYFTAVLGVLERSSQLLDGPVSPEKCKVFMDEMGLMGENYRSNVYQGFSGNKTSLGQSDVVHFANLALAFLDHTISINRRADGLYHSYNLVHFDQDGYSVQPLGEMLEGQVAVLNSGYLEPEDSIALLDALRASEIYRSDQNSYLLYPDKKLPLFVDKNVIEPDVVKNSQWIQDELTSGRRDFVEQDINGGVHFNGEYKNAEELSAGLAQRPDMSEEVSTALCEAYEKVFRHRQFTGRSGAMYKYEGLGCIYWHMVSKLLLATGEAAGAAARDGAHPELVTGLIQRYYDIKDGLGIHKTPAQYGAFPIDAYSHTPSFAGVQQPGLTGQVKEDVISRFNELGINVDDGDVEFSPVLLKRTEFLGEPETWRYSVGGAEQWEDVEAGSLAFSMCGVPFIYRLAQGRSICVYRAGGDTEIIPGSKLGPALSQSLFRRDKTILKIIVDLSEDALSQAEAVPR